MHDMVAGMRSCQAVCSRALEWSQLEPPPDERLGLLLARLASSNLTKYFEGINKCLVTDALMAVGEASNLGAVMMQEGATIDSLGSAGEHEKNWRLLIGATSDKTAEETANYLLDVACGKLEMIDDVMQSPHWPHHPAVRMARLCIELCPCDMAAFVRAMVETIWALSSDFY